MENTRTEELRLSNGIPVLLHHTEGQVAAIYWWVQAGSADEKRNEAGFAHFLEHMLFKDAAAKETGRASTGRLAQAVESLGGDINAYTSFDQTVYHVTCAERHWEKIVDAFGSMAGQTKFLKQDFEREREVILEELRKNEDSPGRQIFQALFSSSYKKHPYGFPVIGNKKNLKGTKVGSLERFYRENYGPLRMGLVLVGPIGEPGGSRERSLKQLLEKHFGARSLPAHRGHTRTPRTFENPLRARAGVTLKPFDVQTPTLALAVRVPELSHEDIAALDILAGALGMGEASRLHQKLFQEKSLVVDVSASLYVPQDPGLLFFQVELENMDRIAPALDGLLSEIVKTKEEVLSSDEIKRVVTNLESEKLYATQTADGIASRLGFLRFGVGDLHFDERYLSKARSLTGEAIREIAKKYFVAERLSSVLLFPKKVQPPQAKEIENLIHKRLGTSNSATSKPVKTKPSRGEPELRTHASGIRFIHRERGDSPVFSIHASVLGGTRLESPEVLGLSHLLGLTWTKGTASLTSHAIASFFENHAASIDGFSGRNSIGLQLTGLTRDWDQFTGPFVEVLSAPSFPDSEVDHARRLAEDAIRTLEDHSNQLCSQAFLETLYENHPYGRLKVGSLKTLPGIDASRLKHAHSTWVRSEALVISVSGGVSEKRVSDLLDRVALALGKTQNASQSTKINEEPELPGPRTAHRKFGREQAHLLLGGFGLRLSSPDRYAIRILQNILGGQSGQLFLELREKRSLAYSVSPVSMEGIERGYLGTYIAFAPEKKKQAIEGIKTVLEHIAKKGVKGDELVRAREFYLGHRAMELQSDSAMAAHLGLEVLCGVGPISEAEVVSRVREVSSREVKKACEQYLVKPYQVLSIVE